MSLALSLAVHMTLSPRSTLEAADSCHHKFHCIYSFTENDFWYLNQHATACCSYSQDNVKRLLWQRFEPKSFRSRGQWSTDWANMGRVNYCNDLQFIDDSTLLNINNITKLLHFLLLIKCSVNIRGLKEYLVNVYCWVKNRFLSKETNNKKVSFR